MAPVPVSSAWESASNAIGKSRRKSSAAATRLKITVSATGIPFHCLAVYQRLVDPLKSGDILLLHDGNAARGPGGAPVILDVLPRLLEAFRARQLTPVTLRGALP
jgi:hypothetical protein